MFPTGARRHNCPAYTIPVSFFHGHDDDDHQYNNTDLSHSLTLSLCICISLKQKCIRTTTIIMYVYTVSKAKEFQRTVQVVRSCTITNTATYFLLQLLMVT